MVFVISIVFVLDYNMEHLHIKSVSIDEIFPEKWIGRRCLIDCIVCLPDFTPREIFSFWEYSRTNFLVDNHVKNDVKNYIGDAFQRIKTKICLCKIVCWSVEGKLQSSVNCDEAVAWALALIKFSGLLDCIIVYNKM